MKQTRVQTKFLLGLAAILLFFVGLSSVTVYHNAKKTLEEEAYDKTELIMTAMAANRKYVREILRPKMYETLEDETFILEAMSSSFISRSVMERVHETLKDFSYRRVAVNARNPRYEANSIEAEMIDKFRENPEMDEWHGIVDFESKRYYMRFKPEYFASSCTYCHGDPADAPQKIIELYGDSRGFYRTPGDVVGLISVGLPVDLSLAKIKESAIAAFMVGIPLILALYAIISVFFNRFIVQNLHNLLDIFKGALKDEKGLGDETYSRNMDEIHELNQAAKVVASQLKKNRQQLEDYTEQLLQGKELLQSVFDGISDPVILLDHRARIKIVNQEFQKRHGLKLDKILDLTPLELQLENQCPLTLCEDVFWKMPDAPVTKEVRLPSGEIFLIYFYPIQSTIGVVDNLVCYVKDITEQKKLETKIQQTEKLVSMGQLAAGIAHEINNPLGVILCHIDLLKDEPELSDEAQGDLKIIKKHAGNCRNIIADLLKFAHQQRTVKAPASINSIISEVVSMVASQFQKNKIDLVTDLQEDLPELRLDADKVKQVILNLLINSSHAIYKDGNITIRSSFNKTSGSCIVVVEDTGAGIPEEKIAKIFDPFFTTKPPGEGTGLGLSVSYGIIKDHNGDIRVESKIGQPTKFIISLPVVEAEHE